MKNFLKNIGEKRNRISKPFLIMIFLVAAVWAYIYFSTFYIIVRFDELGRISKNMSVYYNGFKVGKIVSIEPDRDFKHTLAKVVFSVKKLNLPDNTKVELKSFPSGELYLQLVYPSSVSLKNLKRGLFSNGLSDVTISTTGVAGPTGGTLTKPVGLTYIAIGTKDKVHVFRHIFKGNRKDVRKAASQAAMFYAIKILKDNSIDYEEIVIN